MTVTPLDYAPWRATTLGATTERLERAAVLELAGPLAGRDVLDVRCGDGTYAIAAAQAGARAVGVDPSAAALDAARSRATEAGAGVELLEGRAQRLRRAHFRSLGELREMVREAGLEPVGWRAAAFYPPVGLAAQLMAPLGRSGGERRLGLLSWPWRGGRGPVFRHCALRAELRTTPSPRRPRHDSWSESGQDLRWADSTIDTSGPQLAKDRGMDFGRRGNRAGWSSRKGQAG